MTYKSAYNICAMKLLSDRIHHIIEQTGMSPSFIAKHIGLTASAVLQWESGHTKTIRPEHLFKLADLTGFDPRWIGTGDGPEHNIMQTNHRVVELVNNYTQLDERGRQHVLQVAEHEAAYVVDRTRQT